MFSRSMTHAQHSKHEFMREIFVGETSRITGIGFSFGGIPCFTQLAQAIVRCRGCSPDATLNPKSKVPFKP